MYTYLYNLTDTLYSLLHVISHFDIYQNSQYVKNVMQHFENNKTAKKCVNANLNSYAEMQFVVC